MDLKDMSSHRVKNFISHFVQGLIVIAPFVITIYIGGFFNFNLGLRTKNGTPIAGPINYPGWLCNRDLHYWPFVFFTLVHPYVFQV